MSKHKTHLQETLERHKDIPLPPEYKQVFFQYIRLFHKWMEPVNHALDNMHEVENLVTTAAAFKKAEEMKNYVEECCWMRDGILVTTSLLIYIGMNIPSLENLNKFKKLLTIIDDNMLLYLAVIQRYHRTIKSHIRLSLKGLQLPITFGDVQKMKEFPDSNLMDAAFVNGQKIMGIYSTKTR